MPADTRLFHTAAILTSASVLIACSPTKASQVPTTASVGHPAGPSGHNVQRPIDSVPTGRALKSLLPTAADLPDGWALGSADTAFDSGDQLETSGRPQLPDDDCHQALAVSGAKSLTADFQASYAERGLTAPDGADADVVVKDYRPGDSAREMDEVNAVAKRCAKFTADDRTGQTLRMSTTATAIPGLADTALDVKVTSADPDDATEIVLIPSGDIILAVDATDQSDSGPALLSLARKLFQRLPPKR